ncbi:MAG: preprotein translocase subunit SecE [Deltaproteobacteria bacterium]|nr:preprotein translocase subunit SecE [Deltaproteobacteria bacterium]
MEQIDKTKQFISEANQELKRVTWPVKKHVVASTWVVIALVLVISIVLGLVDAGLSRLVRLILG